MTVTSPATPSELSKALDQIQETELRDGIIRLFVETQEQIDAGEVQVVVLAARRFACLYSLMLDAGMEALRGALIVSDRYLDTCPKQSVTGVVILDDSVVLGTTLHRLASEVREAFNPDTVRCRAVVVDTETRAEYLLRDIGFAPLYERSAESVRKFAVNIVEQLFVALVPFFADFPATRAFTVPSQAWLDYLDGDGWYVADVTAPLLEAPGRQAIAQVPTEATRRDILTRLVPEVAELVDTLKLRSYVKRQDDAVRIVFVPLATVAACTTDVLDSAILAGFSDSESAREAVLNWAPAGKHRAVQLLASLCVLGAMRPAMAKTFGESFAESAITAATDPAALELYLGECAPVMSAAYRTAVDRFVATPPGTHEMPVQLRVTRPTPANLMREEEMRNILFDTRELLSGAGLPGSPSVGSLTKVGLILGHALASMFGFVDARYERDQRDEILSLGSVDAYEKWRATGSERLLDQGFTLQELTEELVPECLDGDAWQRALVSLGIDMGNDLGVVVPVTRYDDWRGIAYRSYRIGETAYLASTPLVTVDQETWDVDLLTLRVKESFPVVSRMRSIRDNGPADDPDGWTHLQAVIHDAIPSQVVARHHGVVTRQDDESLLADLRSPTDDDDGQATVSLKLVSEEDQELVQPGASFVLFEFKDHGPRLRFLSPSTGDIEELHRRASFIAQRVGD